MTTHKLLTYALTAMMAVVWTKAGAQTESYGYFIGGVEINSENCNDITAENFPAIRKGKVSYDHATRTITLTDATIETFSLSNAIANNTATDSLTIVLKGENKLTGNSAVIGCWESPTIIDGEGSGKLTIISQDDCAIYMPKPVIIRGCELTATGKYGIAGKNGKSGEHLTIDNATVRAKGNGTYGSVCDIASLTLNGCQIASPAGAAYNASLKGVALGGALVKAEVVIEPTQTGISSATDDRTEISAVYSPDGRRINTPQRGLNLMKGTDGKMRKVIVK